MHRRAVQLEGRSITVLSPRPSDRVRFATNRFHQTWHVLSDIGGGRYFGRLCWAMAYNRKPGTIVVINKPQLTSSPFDGDPSLPILIADRSSGVPKPAGLAALRKQLAKPVSPDGTVKLQTHGLDRYADGQRDFMEDRRNQQHFWKPANGWIKHSRGFIVLTAPPPVLRQWGYELTTLGDPLYSGQDHRYLEFSRKQRVEQFWPEGEVQVFAQFHRMVSEARQERRRLFPNRDHELLKPEERALIYQALAERSRV